MKIPYGESNFKNVIENDYYYIDKSQHIKYLENCNSNYVFLLRPRRFGKSLFVSMLEHYYGIEHKDEFQQLFGKLHIGKNPTPLANSFLILKFEFSGINTTSDETTSDDFLKKVIIGVTDFFRKYQDLFPNTNTLEILDEDSPNRIMINFFSKVQEVKTKIYILIDEYDHFANELLAFRFDSFATFVSKNGFVRKFYETIKTATGDGIVQRIFATGVTPITLDSLTSGFNIASNISTDLMVNDSMGFTENEVIQLLDDAAHSLNINNFDANEYLMDLQKWYNGYLFHKSGENKVYNPDMILYFTKEFLKNKFKEYPQKILDINIASDYSKLRKLFNIQNRQQNYAVIDKIIKEGNINVQLTDQYSLERPFTSDDFASLLFYMGYLSIQSANLSALIMQIPNFVVKSIFYDYFVELIRKEAALEAETPDIRDIVTRLAQENNIAPFIELIETTLHGLSNRDFIKFDEKYIKLLFVAFANVAGFYYVKSEPEISQKYPDVMFLYRPPYFPKYQFVFELKYLKKQDADQVDAKRIEAENQLTQHWQNKELQDFITRAEGGMETVKGYAVVFVGEKAEVVKEISF